MCECGGKCGSNCTCGGNCKGEGTCSCHDKVERKLLFCIVGKSASGKDMLCKALSERLGWKQVCSYTERPMREGETNGVEHWFVTSEEMDRLFNAENVIAKTQIGNIRYCATTDCIDENTKLYIVDPEGVKYLEEKSEELGIDFCVFYIDVDDDIRLHRAAVRGDNADVMRNRFEAECESFDSFKLSLFNGEPEYLYYVYSNNGNFEETYAYIACDMLALSSTDKLFGGLGYEGV